MASENISRTLKQIIPLLTCAMLVGCAVGTGYTFSKNGSTYTLAHDDKEFDSSDCRAFVPGYSAGQSDLFEQRAQSIRAKIDEAHARGHAYTLTEAEYQRTFGTPYAAPVPREQVASAFTENCIVHDDGTGAQISVCLPTRETVGGVEIIYTTFRIHADKGDKILLLTDLNGRVSDDGKTFEGDIIIPSALLDSAEILLLGSPPNSNMGYSKHIKATDFKRVHRKKSWTEQE